MVSKLSGLEYALKRVLVGEYKCYMFHNRRFDSPCNKSKLPFSRMLCRVQQIRKPFLLMSFLNVQIIVESKKKKVKRFVKTKLGFFPSPNGFRIMKRVPSHIVVALCRFFSTVVALCRIFPKFEKIRRIFGVS